MNLSQFIQEYCNSFSNILTEGVQSRDINKAQALIRSYLVKSKIYTMPITVPVIVDGERCQLVECFQPDRNLGAAFIWNMGDTRQIKAVGFTSDFNEHHVELTASAIREGKVLPVWEVYVESKGTNVVQMCKLVQKVLTGKVDMTVAAVREEIMDSQLFESVEEMVTEASDDRLINDLVKRRNSIYHKIRNLNKKGADVTSLQDEYNEITKQLAEARTSIRSNVSAKPVADPDLEKAEANFQETMRATPEERFSDMKTYIYNVIAGIRPLALLCGAPGVGKTYRVMQAVKGTGKQQDVDYKLMKGKCTPTALFMALHDFKNEGQLLIMDDCDSIFQDPNAINLIKAACDSSDERWVTWGIASQIPMDEETAAKCDDAVIMNGKYYYPKQFQTLAGMIIITNFSAGQIDTAIRNRALICDLNFTTQEILDLVKGIAPSIQPNILPMAAKEKALDYLRQLADSKAPVELSIRTFTLCAGLFASDCPESQVRRMINEQMRLNFLRGGKRY